MEESCDKAHMNANVIKLDCTRLQYRLQGRYPSLMKREIEGNDLAKL